jgi:hypothetical protein
MANGQKWSSFFINNGMMRAIYTIVIISSGVWTAWKLLNYRVDLIEKTTAEHTLKIKETSENIVEIKTDTKNTRKDVDEIKGDIKLILREMRK